MLWKGRGQVEVCSGDRAELGDGSPSGADVRAAVMLRRRVTAHSTPPQSLSTLTQFLSHTGETRKKKPRPCFFQLVFVIRQGGREGNEGEF